MIIKVKDIPKKFRPKFNAGDKIIVRGYKGSITQIKYSIHGNMPSLVFGPHYEVFFYDPLKSSESWTEYYSESTLLSLITKDKGK